MSSTPAYDTVVDRRFGRLSIMPSPEAVSRPDACLRDGKPALVHRLFRICGWHRGRFVRDRSLRAAVSPTTICPATHAVTHFSGLRRDTPASPWGRSNSFDDVQGCPLNLDACAEHFDELAEPRRVCRPRRGRDEVAVDAGGIDVDRFVHAAPCRDVGPARGIGRA